MDPEATLLRAAEAMRASDFNEAMELIAAYRRWRRFGGCQPPDGDQRAKLIERTIRRWLKSNWRQRNAK